MSRYEEYSIEWVEESIEQEHIGYFLTSYCDLNKIKNTELRKLCLDAEDAILAIEDFFKEYYEGLD